MKNEHEYCTFYLEGLLFGIEVAKVQEVLRHQAMTRVPLTAEVIGGLINLRGQIVTAIDLRHRLGLPRRSDASLPLNVVVRFEDGAVSLLVDEIGEVVAVNEAQFEASPDTLRGQARQLIDGVYKLKDRLMHVLSLERAVNVPSAEGSGETTEWRPATHCAA